MILSGLSDIPFKKINPKVVTIVLLIIILLGVYGYLIFSTLVNEPSSGTVTKASKEANINHS